MRHEKWQCLKCEHDEFETGKLSAAGGFFARMFDIQNRRFTTVTCARCKYTELYKVEAGALGNVLDLLVG